MCGLFLFTEIQQCTEPGSFDNVLLPVIINYGFGYGISVPKLASTITGTYF